MAGCELVTSVLLPSAKPIPRCFQLEARNAHLGGYHMKAFLYFSLIFFFLRKITVSSSLTLIKEITSFFACCFNLCKEKCNIQREFLHVRFVNIYSPEYIGVYIYLMKAKKKKKVFKRCWSLFEIEIIHFWIYCNQRVDLLTLDFV